MQINVTLIKESVLQLYDLLLYKYEAPLKYSYSVKCNSKNCDCVENVLNKELSGLQNLILINDAS